MAKLKQLIRQLKDEDYQQIKEVLLDSNAEKSVSLIETVRENNYSDTDIMKKLGVTSSAYYTLRSRLNKKIEEYLLQQMEYPRTDLIRKVSNINETIFTSKRTVAITALKKLEKELIDYDLSNELTIVYKSLKKLYINSPEHFHYSQLYNRHVAYTLAVDKAEDLLNEYFKKYGDYLMKGEKQLKTELSYLRLEMYNVCKLYKSHRLLVYMNLMNIFHRLCVNPEDEKLEEELSVDAAFQKVNKVINSYRLDLIYYHLSVVFDLLKTIQLYVENNYRTQKRLENSLKELTHEAPHLLENFSMYTFPAQLLIMKVDYSIDNKMQPFLEKENIEVFEGYAPFTDDIASSVIYYMYRALGCFHNGSYKEASVWLYKLLNSVNFKEYPVIQTDVKLTAALCYLLLNDKELFKQTINSAERNIRVTGKEHQYPSYLIMKVLKTSFSKTKKDKAAKIKALMNEYYQQEISYWSGLKNLLWNKDLINRISV